VELRARGPLPGLPILFEDAHLVAVDKPAGIPVHPGGRLLEDTVITRLQARYRSDHAASVASDGGKDADDPGAIVPKLCHRLDLETSGVLLVAKSDAVAAEMGRQMRRRETVKEYLALVHGVVDADEFVIEAPIGDHPASQIHNRRGVVEGGSPSKTGVTVERRFADFTLVRCRLFTGRRHQIRCHLHHRGFPVVGDKVYGLDETFFLAYFEERLDAETLRLLLLPRQALHATRLVVTHPKTKEPLEVHSPLPADLAAFLDTLEAWPGG
jgi:23S rRNA pseudouridine1911/1915/1917 synthase